MKQIIALTTSLLIVAFFVTNLTSCENPKEEMPGQAIGKWRILGYGIL